MTDLPPDFPPDLRDGLGIKPEPPATTISAAIRAALKASRESRGKTH